jgi:hypothetical protein
VRTVDVAEIVREPSCERTRRILAEREPNANGRSGMYARF